MVYVFLVGAGGFLGSASRYLLSGLVQRLDPALQFPTGTLAVNVLGCAAIGILSELAESRGALTPEARSFLIIGVLGGFTTLSAFANETLNLLRAGQALPAGLNAAANVLLGLAGVWLGRLLAHWIWR
jgi:CrcB protein